MPDYIFNPDRCPVPPLAKIPRVHLITDCNIPEAPDPIRQCQDLEPDFVPVPDLPMVPPAPPEPPGGERCRQVWSGAPCIDVSGFTEFQDSVPVTSLIFRRNSSFRIWGLENTLCPGQYDLVVDIGGGPTDSVFWQGPGGQPPKWTTCPNIGHSIKVGTTVQPGWWISVGPDGGLAFASGDRTNQAWRAPNANAQRDRCYLYADAVNGSCHQLAWSYPGIDGEFVTYAGIKVTVKKGLITAITGFDLPGSNTAVTCDISPCTPYDPCP